MDKDDLIIALLDLDYFYAQCEQIRNPLLKNKPVVIVMPTLRGSGAVATCNYIARSLKIRSGMPLSLAKKLSNNETVFINADKIYYQEMSKKVFGIVDFFCEKVEQVSIDEAYIDLTNPESFDKAIKTIKNIKNKIKSDLGLTCSIGLSVNKLIAKMASNEKKPDGLTVILPNEINSFLLKKSVSELPGVGPKSLSLFKKRGIIKINDLQKISKEELISDFGKSRGETFYDFSRGIDRRGVISNREKQQISRMITLKTDSSNFSEIVESISLLSQIVFKESQKIKKSFKTISLIIVNNKFETIYRSKTIDNVIDLEEFIEIENNLLKDFLNESFCLVRRVGVRVSNFDLEFGMQKSLFDFK